jgi:hypothetical protein
MTVPFGPAAVPSENAFRVVLGLGAGAALVALAIASVIPRRRPAAVPALQTGGPRPHDIDLDLPGEAFPAPLAGRSRRLETAEATT